MTFSISTAMDKAAELGTWKAAYENIMRSLGFDDDDPDYFAQAMADKAIDEDIVANWNKASPAQRQWMITEIGRAPVFDRDFPVTGWVPVTQCHAVTRTF